MSKRSSPELLIEDIIKSAEKILRYTTGVTFEEFEINDLLIDAVIRNFEIIGEAANRLPEDFKEKHNHRAKKKGAWPPFSLLDDSNAQSHGEDIRHINICKYPF
jgi:hypothetical protein